MSRYGSVETPVDGMIWRRLFEIPQGWTRVPGGRGQENRLQIGSTRHDFVLCVSLPRIHGRRSAVSRGACFTTTWHGSAGEAEATTSTGMTSVRRVSTLGKLLEVPGVVVGMSSPAALLSGLVAILAGSYPIPPKPGKTWVLYVAIIMKTYLKFLADATSGIVSAVAFIFCSSTGVFA